MPGLTVKKTTQKKIRTQNSCKKKSEIKNSFNSVNNTRKQISALLKITIHTDSETKADI
jgi:hypothetical protein